MQRTFRRRFPAVFRRRLIVDLMGVEPTTPTLQGSVAPNGMQARVEEVRPGLEPDLPPYHGGVLPQHLQTIVSVIPGRIELPISWVSSRRLCHWTTGSRQ